MGLGATLLGRYFGAAVIGVDINTERLALARSLGATHTIDASESAVPAAVRELTNGRGLDIAMECAGSDTTLQYALESMGHFGHVALVGEHRQATVNPSAHFLGHELTMTGTRYYHVSDYDDILQLIASGLRPERIVTHRFALADAPQALQLFDLGQTAKVVLLP
jgi:propanol-preferring alcohol dehydrogenase